MPPFARLVEIAGVDQREQGEGRVAEPAEAIVPVAHAADLLGDRGRRRGDDPAGRPVGQRLEGQERADDGLVLAGPVAVAAARPGAASRRRRRGSTPSASRPAGGLLGRRMPGQGEGDLLPLPHDEVGDGGVALAAMLDPRPQPQLVGPGDRRDAPLVARHPGDDPAVVEPDDQLRPHRDLAAQPLDDPGHRGRVAVDRHRVGDPHGPRAGGELGLQHHASPAGIAARPSCTSTFSAGASFQRPFSGEPSRAAKHAPESNRGTHSQSIEPSRPTSAAVRQSPIIA